MRGTAVAAAGLIGSGLAYKLVVEPWWKQWGHDPELSERALPGDDLVPHTTRGETRAIGIDAPPSLIWPWLVQMGFGRAGWYSYDLVDMRGSSSHVVVPAWQHLAVGDVVPTHPGGGFEVRVLEPDHALVLYSDAALVERQADAARKGGELDVPVNLQASGTLLAGTQPAEFKASWAFVLLPGGQGGTTLVERFRVEYGEGSAATPLTLPLLGFGVFLMMRRQMLGIRRRAERLAAERAAA